MKIPEEDLRKKKQYIESLRTERLPWWNIWRQLANYYLPNRYVTLLSPLERTRLLVDNPYILDGTGTNAARTLASGMMNGITSPSRPWFKLRLAGTNEEASTPARKWLDEVERRMMLIMSESNFYNALAVMYLDLVVFGTAALIIYEDAESVIRCYSPPLGEFYLGQSSRLQVNRFAREFCLKVGQLEEMFGEENLSETTLNKYKMGGARNNDDIEICHMIEPHYPGDKYGIASSFAYRECYWEKSAQDGTVLRVRGFNEFPVIAPRYELSGNDSYGASRAMDALGDVKQLQQETKAKGKSLDRMNDPPVIADIALQHKPLSLLPRGITYVPNANGVGVKPIHTVQPPIQELTLDLRDIQARIRETFHNDLFRMISELDTVRSATEIDARKEEKLVLLGPVLERFETEALDPAINRIFSIMERAKLLPEAPQEIAEQQLEIQYVSILSTAQRAVGTVSVERWLQLIGGLAGLKPELVNIPDFDELIRGYGSDLGVPARYMHDKDRTGQLNEQYRQQLEAQQAAETGTALVQGAKTLSEADVGGGANALQTILGG